MSMSPGTRVGFYDILAPLGAGGMGEVYRATDTKLKRQVAIKILPPALAADPDRLARFQREAEVLASLNHQHIAAIYGLEDAGGMKALVMELVEGPTLADRIAEGPIPLDEALPIAMQIAAALEAAHEQGIVHRDLKPANIKVRDDGTVKVLDFGLAKLTDAGMSSRIGRDDLSQSPTLASPAMTGLGIILGTAAYMSPEQARGRAVDKRTDVWAFGAVLYEMLTGVRAFPGEDVTETMAAVVKSTPDWAPLRAGVPPHIVTLIERCLEKDRNARIGDVAVARFLLADRAALGASPAVATAAVKTAAPRWREALPVVLAAVVGALLFSALVAWWLSRRAPDAALVTHLQMSTVPADHLVGSIASVRPARTAIAISPDGRRVVFAATHGAASQLYLRGLDRPDAAPIPGTEGAVAPFFSPDGAWVGFWADNKIKKAPLAGGPPATICDVSPGGGLGASWGADGTIIFASRTGIAKVSSAGGTPTPVRTTSADKDERQLLPQLLPDGKAFLFTAIASNDWETANVMLQPLDDGERRTLIPGGADARYVAPGHLVYMKSGTLMAVPFDLRSRQVSGAAVALVENVMQAVNAANGSDETGAGQFAVSKAGTLVYVVGGAFPTFQDALTWVDRTGAAEPFAAAPPASYLGPRLSPDGQKLAVAIRRAAPRGVDLWVYDVVRGAPTRLTFNGNNNQAVWSPDGKRLAYAVNGTDANGVYVLNADGGGKPERLNDSGFPSSWTAAPNAIAFLRRAQDGSSGIWVLPLERDAKPRSFIESRFTLWYPELSPDGQLMAYMSNESGNAEVYVQPYPGPGEKTRISTAGGIEPIWAANGRELFYRSMTLERQQFFSATVHSTSPFGVDTPRLMFEAKAGEYDSTVPERSWDVSADGKRFLVSKPANATDKPVTEMHVVLNWAEELTRLVPASR